MLEDAKIAVIVLNFRTPEITIACLKTLAQESAACPSMRVVLVDNASEDDSVSKIQSAISENQWDLTWLEFRPLEKNLGFAGGNNAIMRELMSLAEPPEYILLLNSDTILSGRAIAYCSQIMESDSSIGAMSCMLRNADGSVQNVCRRFPTPLRESARAFGLPWIFPSLFRWADLEDRGWDRSAGPRNIDWIGGAFFFVRTKAIKEVGFLDEDFFFYGEDCEYCFRLRKHGWGIRFDPGAEIVHFGGSSSDSTRVRNREKDIHTWKARLLIQRKCYGRLAEMFVHGAYITMFALRRLYSLLRGDRSSQKAADIQSGLEILIGGFNK